METEKKNSMLLTSVEMWLTKNPEFRNLSPIDHLFNKLETLYPGKWNAQFSSDAKLQEWKLSWAEEFVEERITFDEIKVALNYCKKNLDWPPTFPQFFKACRPSLDYEAAFHEAIQQMHLRAEGRDEWSNPAIYHAAARIGMDMNNPYANIKTRWKSELDKAIYDVSAGHLPFVIQKRVKTSGYLPAPKREGKYTETAKKALAERDAILNTEPAWKKALREKGRDTSSPRAGLKPMSDYINIKQEEIA